MSSSSPARRFRILLVAGVVTLAGLLATSPAPSQPQAVSMAEVVTATPAGSSPAGLTPADIADAYGLTGGLSGGTVGIVIPYDTPTLESDLATYRSQFGLPACTTANGCFRKVDQSGGTSYPSVDAGWSLEASLDVQSVSASCPSCHILVVETASAGMTSLGTGVNEAVSLGASAVSMSWGARESSSVSYYQDRYFTHPGVPMIAATGDLAYPQAYMPATMGTVIAVGGTTLSHTSATASAAMGAAARDAVTVTNGGASASAALTAAQEHAATLAHAEADLATARTKATTAAKAVTAAEKAVAVQKRLLSADRAKYTAAVKRAKHSRSAAITRALASAKRTYATRSAAYKKATALVTSRTRTLTTANRAVVTLTAAVASAQAVVTADQRAATTPITTIPVTIPQPVITAPTQTGSTGPIGPLGGTTTTPVTTPTTPVSVPDPVATTPEPTPTVTPAPTPDPTPTRTNAAPTAGFSFTRNGLAVAFDASNSSDPDGSIASYAWDFGDGSSGSGVTAAHSYAASGSYTATLTVTDDEGATTSTSATVTVTAPAPVAISAARGSWMETAWSDGGSGCSTYTGKPAWQTDTACSTRTVADISAVGDSNTGLAVFDTAAIAQGYTSDGWIVVGGTSLATPLIAGMMVRSGHAANYSDASPLYANRSAFWDVTSGSNGSCAGSSVCTAGVGYDAPTGLGTPKSLASF